MTAKGRALLDALTEEALRLFFPLAALHAALWPLLWTWIHRLDLPLVRTMPPSIWHGHEMIFGAYGAALIGFLLTAIPEWTATRRPPGVVLLTLAGLWGGARVIGFLGADWAGAAAGIADIAWLAGLVLFILRVSWSARTSSLIGFLFWLAALLACEVALRCGMVRNDVQLAQSALLSALLVFAALLALALARITPPITNRILDPSRTTTPFRPHPGRRNLAPALIALCLAAMLAGASPSVTAFLLLAAGAAFMDRVAESFVGRSFFRLELLALSGSAALAGLGLLLIGAGMLGLPIAGSAGLHVLSMGGLGVGVVGVFSIAGKLHTGQDLPLSKWMALALTLILAATALRVAPSLGVAPPGPLHGLASLAWAAAFGVWLWRYWPALSASQQGEHPPRQ